MSSRIPLFDASFLLGDDPNEGYDRSLDPHHLPPGSAIYPGKYVHWVGKPGAMLQLTPDFILPQMNNQWWPNQLAWAASIVRTHPYLYPPVGRAKLVNKTIINYTWERKADDEFQRAFTSRDLGKPCVELWDGHHRAFGAILAGEPFLWIYVPVKFRKAVRKWLR